MMGAFFADLRYALRGWRRSPGFALVALITLGLGIGGSTAVFTLFDRAFLEAIAAEQPQELVQLRYTGSARGHSQSFGGDDHLYFSHPMYRDLRRLNTVFSGVVAADLARVGVLGQSGSRRELAEVVSGNYFQVLGARAALGRTLVDADDGGPNSHPVVVLSYEEWQREFASDPAVVGRTLAVNGSPFEIVGVLARGASGIVSDVKPRLFFPLSMRPVLAPEESAEEDFNNRRYMWLPIFARLRPGVTVEQARASLEPVWHALRADELKLLGHTSPAFVDRFLTHSTLELEPARTGFSPTRESARTPLTLLMAMVLLLLAMAAANVASLLLVRGSQRTREMAVRSALGAARGRLVRQLVAEGLLLGLGGGLLGVALAPAMAAPIARRLLDIDEFSVAPDVRVLGFALGVSLLVSVVFSLLPALSLLGRRAPSLEGLRQSHGIAGGHTGFLRRGAVLLQIGLSVLLLSGAGLLLRTLHNLKAQDFGLSLDHVVTFSLDPMLAGYTPEASLLLHRRVEERLAATLGVEAVGGTTDAELANADDTGDIQAEGYQPAPGEQMEAEQPTVTPGYFSSLRIPLLAGRLFTPADGMGGDKVAIVNELLAKRYFGNAQAALGRMVGLGSAHGSAPDTRIVGVVRDARHKLRDEALPTVFEPFRGQRSLRYYVRSREAPGAAEASVRAAVREVDPRLVVDPMRSMEEQVNGAVSTESMLALLAAAFGAVALLTTGIGLYGVLAYATAQRTREIGVRMALGAMRTQVVRLVLADTILLAAISVVLALGASVVLGRLIRSQLYGVALLDPLVLGACALLAAGMVALAALVPAWRAVSIEPNQALRTE